MSETKRWYAGVDWGSQIHCVFLTDGQGRKLGQREFKHSGEGLAEMAAWLMKASLAEEPAQVLVAIEVPHGPVVETLIERGFAVHALNPKQMDRFRDRFSMAGAKDDSRDAEVMASSLRTDRRVFPPARNQRSRSSSSCGNGRASLRNSALSAIVWPTACASNFGVTFLPCSNSKPTSAPNGCSSFSILPRRPPKPRGCARARSPSCSKNGASAASTPYTSSNRARLGRRSSRREPSRPQAPMSLR